MNATAKLPPDGAVIDRPEGLPNGIKIIDAKDVDPADFECLGTPEAVRSGLVENIVVAIRQLDGRFVIRTQAMITAKGLADLKTRFGTPIN